jgi:hypothetical protein
MGEGAGPRSSRTGGGDPASADRRPRAAPGFRVPGRTARRSLVRSERPDSSSPHRQRDSATTPSAGRSWWTTGQSPTLALVFGILAVPFGLAVAGRFDAYQFTLTGAIGGIGSQLPTTAPAAVELLLATTVNIWAGAVALRVVRGIPYDSITDLVLGGLAAAVLLDTAVLLGLGSIGLFGWPELAAICLGLTGSSFLARPVMARPVRVPVPTVSVAWMVLVGLFWCGPILLQAASPVVPFMDVLPNHVAPVEHVRAFGSFATLTTSPSPIYGPSRIFLGYVGLLSALSVLTGLHAALTVAAFILPLTVITALSVAQLGRTLLGRSAARWALLLFPLTFVFLRLSDARATVLVVPLLAWGLHLACAMGRDARARASWARRDAGLAATLAAAMLVHPLMGLLGTITVVIAAAAESPGVVRRVVVASAGAGVIVLPQLATTVGLDLPSWCGLLVVPVVIVVPVALERLTMNLVPWTTGPLAPRRATASLVPIGALAASALALVVTGATRELTDLASNYAYLGVLAATGVALAARRPRRGWRLLIWAVTVGLLAVAVTASLPGGTPFLDSLHQELSTKAMEYWTPWVLSLAAGAALAELWRRRWLGPLRSVATGVLLVLLVVPISAAAPETGPVEHRVGETLALDLRFAESGYWRYYPDWRLVVDPAGQQVIDLLRTAEATGRLGPGSRVLHFAQSSFEWMHIPLGEFTGAMETLLVPDPEQSIHTAGGRILPLTDAAAQLDAQYAVVVLEPAGLPDSLRGEIVGRGYRSVLRNSRAEVFERP